MLCHHTQDRRQGADPQRPVGGYDNALMGWFSCLQDDVTADLIHDHVTQSAAQVLSEAFSVE